MKHFFTYSILLCCLAFSLVYSNQGFSENPKALGVHHWRLNEAHKKKHPALARNLEKRYDRTISKKWLKNHKRLKRIDVMDYDDERETINEAEEKEHLVAALQYKIDTLAKHKYDLLYDIYRLKQAFKQEDTELRSILFGKTNDNNETTEHSLPALEHDLETLQKENTVLMLELSQWISRCRTEP